MAGLPIAVQNQRPRVKLHNLLATLVGRRAIAVAEKRSKLFVGTVGGYNGFVRTGMVPAQGSYGKSQYIEAVGLTSGIIWNIL